jgi:mannose-6-phosphate isomerase-like protein (cupin superfamily)
MRLVSREDIRFPIKTDSGETIYEMVGAGPDSGETRHHSVAYVVVGPGNSVTRHYHWDSEETYYFLKGAPIMTVNGEELKPKPGQALLLHPGDRHELSNPNSDPVEFLAISGPAWVPTDTFAEEAQPVQPSRGGLD